ncbi:Aste57867_20986 [Aphanomyces stellatus]|uniref:Aste57867_20986 protein n=1 Tax=Aphanomyces stellatus TaxID=120398 RepID=A0A485LGH4_9STRA|nr:hypothetical protein As57867_020918 [Aphanomyces stellatus]VFT97661.1 Aste57867_20986 [Aphanomyces stellatus]
MDSVVLDDEILQKIYAWIDEIPLSRPKKNMGRDFSDGILAAEVIAFYFPKLVQMHNYSSANSVTQKQYNWGTLNGKVLKRLGFQLTKRDIDDIVQCKPGAVEEFLSKLQVKIANHRLRRNSAQEGHGGGDLPNDAASSSSSGGDLYGGSGGPSLDKHKRSEVREAESKEESPVMDEYPASVASFTSKTSHKSCDSQHQASDLHLELQEKTSIIEEQKETIQILEQKIQKLEQLVRLKDGKIQTLVAKLRTQK